MHRTGWVFCFFFFRRMSCMEDMRGKKKDGSYTSFEREVAMSTQQSIPQPREVRAGEYDWRWSNRLDWKGGIWLRRMPTLIICIGRPAPSMKTQNHTTKKGGSA